MLLKEMRLVPPAFVIAYSLRIETKKKEVRIQQWRLTKMEEKKKI